MSAPKLTEAQREMLCDALNGPIICNAFGRPLDEAADLVVTGLLVWAWPEWREPQDYVARITEAGRAALRGDK